MRDARDHIRGRQARAIEKEHEGDRDVGRDLDWRLEGRRRWGEACQHDRRDQEQGERVGGELGESLAHDGGICPILRSLGMTLFVVSVIMLRDDRNLRSRSTCDLSGCGRDRVFLGSRTAAGLTPIDGKPAGAPARSGTRRRLFDRDTHNVSLTVDGQALTVLAGRFWPPIPGPSAIFRMRNSGAGSASAPRRISRSRASCRRSCEPSLRGTRESTSR